MFVRFRETPYRLQASLIESRRRDGKVRSEHVAYLGSTPVPSSVPDRIVFWTRLHERLGRLSNRVPDPQKIYDAIHARVPMPTADEQHALKIENAEAEELFWSGHRDISKTNAAEHAALGATIASNVAEIEAGAAEAESRAVVAKDRANRLKNGEDLSGGLHRPYTREDLEAALLAAGFTKVDLQRAERLKDIYDYCNGNEQLWAEFLQAMNDEQDRAKNALVNRAWRRLQQHLSEEEPEHQLQQSASIGHEV
jgi:hypothetical protein